MDHLYGTHISVKSQSMPSPDIHVNSFDELLSQLCNAKVKSLTDSQVYIVHDSTTYSIDKDIIWKDLGISISGNNDDKLLRLTQADKELLTSFVNNFIRLNPYLGPTNYGWWH